MPATATMWGGLHTTASRPNSSCHSSSTGAAASVTPAPNNGSVSVRSPNATQRSRRNRCNAQDATVSNSSATPAYSSRWGGEKKVSRPTSVCQASSQYSPSTAATPPNATSAVLLRPISLITSPPMGRRPSSEPST